MRVFALSAPRIAPLLLVAACHGPSPSPTAQSNSSLPPASADSASSSDPAPNTKPASPSSHTPASAPIPALSAEGTIAFVADESGLVEISPKGPSQLIHPGELTSCNVDARGKVVWFEQDDTLYAFDLVDRTIHKILSAGENDALGGDVIVSWGNQKLGGEDRVGYDVALQITMTSPPQIEVSIGCDGDRAHYCYGETAGSKKQRLTDALLSRQEAISKTTFVSPDYVASVAARGANGSLWSAPPLPPPMPRRKPKVDASQCLEDPTACGAIEAIPSSPLWKVVVANEREDFFSEYHTLWDAETNEFLSIEGGKLSRSKTPEVMGDLGGMRVSPTGILSYKGTVFDGRTIYYVPKGEDAMSCGFSDGGFRVRGVRG